MLCTNSRKSHASRSKLPQTPPWTKAGVGAGKSAKQETKSSSSPTIGHRLQAAAGWRLGHSRHKRMAPALEQPQSLIFGVLKRLISKSQARSAVRRCACLGGQESDEELIIDVETKHQSSSRSKMVALSDGLTFGGVNSRHRAVKSTNGHLHLHRFKDAQHILNSRLFTRIFQTVPVMCARTVVAMVILD